MNPREGTAPSLNLGNWALPLFLTRENKYFAGFMMFLVATLLYLSSNHYHFFPPQMLSMTWVDRSIPFIPNTVWIYISEYFFFMAIYIACKDMVNANKYLYSFLALQAVSVIIFWIWPTTYPRDMFPLDSAALNTWTYYAFATLRTADTPANCCPSLHVSSVYLSSFIYLDDQKGKFPFFFIWGTAIAFSTLTTKQHYVVDLIAGFLMAVVFYRLFHRYIPYRPYTAFRLFGVRTGDQANR